MNEKTPSCLIGYLSMDLMFVGSKSEGLYPVLHANDGKQYRLHHKGDISLNEKTLANYEGKTVQVIGNVDKLRGHLRLVLAADSLPLKLEVPPNYSSASGTDAVVEASAGSTSKIAEDLEQEEPSPVNNRSKE